MAASKFRSPWEGVWSLDEIVKRRIRRPRSIGVTMVMDTGLGLSSLTDLLSIASGHIDHWKFGFGTSALTPGEVLEEKLDALRRHEILTYPGGTLLETAVVREHCRIFMARAAKLGFSAVEISEGTIDLPAERRRRMIDCARDAGLMPITEVGRKDPARQPSADELAEQALRDLAYGAAWVIVEARECGLGIGIYDDAGEVRAPFLMRLTSLVGESASRLIWEAPLRAQQAYLVRCFGANVSLGNIVPQDCLALEALRCGLRFETFEAVARHSLEMERWNPARVENAPRIEIEEQKE
jgi:phosphosulfolactate synthase